MSDRLALHVLDTQDEQFRIGRLVGSLLLAIAVELGFRRANAEASGHAGRVGFPDDGDQVPFDPPVEQEPNTAYYGGKRYTDLFGKSNPYTAKLDPRYPYDPLLVPTYNGVRGYVAKVDRRRGIPFRTDGPRSRSEFGAH